MKRTSPIWLLTIFALVLSACTSAPSVDTVKGSEEKFIVVVADEVSPQGEDALIEGTLETVGPCLGFSIPGMNVQRLIIWPVGTSLISEGVRLQDGSTITLGEDFQLSGGYHSSGWAGITEDIPDECMTDQIAIVNSTQDLP